MLPKKPIPARGFRPSGGRYLSSALDENTNRTAQIVSPRSSAMNPMEMRNTLTLVSMSEHPRRRSKDSRVRAPEDLIIMKAVFEAEDRQGR
jgi:hypothetical protein